MIPVLSLEQLECLCSMHHFCQTRSRGGKVPLAANLQTNTSLRRRDHFFTPAIEVTPNFPPKVFLCSPTLALQL